MRNKDHHLQPRGAKYSLRYDIPEDVKEFYPNYKSRTRSESLKTSDIKLARQLRDIRLRELEREWAELRRLKKKRTKKVETADTVEDPENAKIVLERLQDEFDQESMVYAHGIEQNDLIQAREEYAASSVGRELLLRIDIADGKKTMLQPACEEWLATKKKTTSVMYDYRKALDLLCEQYRTFEEIDHRTARLFLTDLLQGKAKPTVQKYCIAYKGVWRHTGRRFDMWSIGDMDSNIDTVVRKRWTDEEYINLLSTARTKGQRELWLAIRIAAYTGASVSGISGLEVRKSDDGLVSLYLPETKKAHRPRLIPCHEVISSDVMEWQKVSLKAQPLSKRFGKLKTPLGYGPEKVFHGFRHSVANKLDNAGVYRRNIRRLLGHKLDDITFDTYSSEGLSYSELKRTIDLIQWPDIKWDDQSGCLSQ